MKQIPMIVAIIVSIFPAQGAVAQNDINEDYGSWNYDDEQREYTEIGITDLPMKIESIASTDFENLNIYRVYLSKDNSYRIVFTGKNNDTKVVLASANGEWIMLNNKT